jgi:O-antigen ligase
MLSSEYSLGGGRLEVEMSAKLLLAISYFSSFLLIFIFRNELKSRYSLTMGLWLLLVIWTGITVILGQFNTATMMRFVGFIGSTSLGLILFTCQKSHQNLIKYLAWVCASIMLTNLLAIDWHVLSDYSSKFVKGIFFQKNILGHFSVLSLFIGSFYLFSAKKYNTVLALLLIMSASWLLLISTSMTSYILIFIAVLSLILSLIMSRCKHGIAIAFSITLLLIVILITNWNYFFSIIGKSTTLTGRTSIWNEYLTLVELRPWVGHGYGAFPEKMTELIKLGPHSGYIELLYYVGIIGALLMTAILIRAFRNWFTLIKMPALNFELSFLFTIVALFLTLNITETYMLNRSGLYWPLFVYATLQLDYLHKIKKKEIEL